MSVTFLRPARVARAEQLADAVLRRSELPTLDRLVRDAARAVGVRDAHLSLLTTEQVTASVCEFGELALHRGGTAGFDDSICANALRAEGPLIIDDARGDARVSSVPAVQRGVVGAYLGIPLHADEFLIGVLCVVAAEPRRWSEQDVARLTAAAHQIEAEIRRIENDDRPR